MIQIRNKRDYEEQFQIAHILKCPKHTDHNKCFLMQVVGTRKETKWDNTTLYTKFDTGFSKKQFL